MGSTPDDPASSAVQHIEKVLGYLNFSSGASDPQFLQSLDTFFAADGVAHSGSDDSGAKRRSKARGSSAKSSKSNSPATWRRVWTGLSESLDRLEAESPAFADAQQARQVINVVLECCPAYVEYHADLLAHHSEESLFNSFFTGRVAEVVLRVLNDGTDTSQILSTTLTRLNDYVGFRPVATLSSRKMEPYKHEWLRPIPLYVEGAGAASGQYQNVVTVAIELLERTEPSLLRAAYFDPRKLTELAMDPRAYDFDHPVSRRPNHQFGMWDPHCIDGDGFYRRYVIQQLTLDCLLQRAITPSDLPEQELLLEAAAVLAGTVLMSSGICGFGPETHDSVTSLSQLLAKIAAYRDEFYRQLILQIDGPHGARLREEADQLQQPFGGARQDLNRTLTACRAIQIQRVHLARIYARMGYSAAAEDQASQIQVPSARLNCDIDCCLTEARQLLFADELDQALATVERSREIILRGIECGAIVDPWNILGFDANFSLFGQIENSIRDYRIDDLIVAVEETMELYSQIWGKAVANERADLAQLLQSRFAEFANWWHQYAAHEMDSVDAEDPLEALDAATKVAEALHAWHAQGEATGDIRFWVPHVQDFDSCLAYWLVINTLLLHDDKDASLGLMMHWLSQADRIPLEHGETSFFQLSLRWLASALEETGALPASGERIGWKRICRFFDYLEANVGELWQVPEFLSEETAASRKPTADDGDENEDEDEEDELFRAAYENVVYRDSTDDGQEGSVFDFDTSPDQDELQSISRTIIGRMAFIDQIATIWKMLSLIWATSELHGHPDVKDPDTAASMHRLLETTFSHLQQISSDMHDLLTAIQHYRLSRSGTDPDSMMEYDRVRLMKESLLDQVITANVSVQEAMQFLVAVRDDAGWSSSPEHQVPVDLLRACIRGEQARAAELWDELQEVWAHTPILYIPLNRGGSPEAIGEARSRQQLIQNLMIWMPRLGLLTETFGLIDLVRSMESVSVGAGAITEFDDLFETACRSLVNALVDCKEANPEMTDDGDSWLVECLEEMIEPLLRTWLEHSRTLRLSVLEQVMDDEAWQQLVGFIQAYGRDIFTQRFLHLGNLRGILHQGVAHWLAKLQEVGDEDQYGSLLDALDHGLDLGEAGDKLTLILEAIVENYSEYRDYNSTTTQSDQGDLLYSLLDFLRLRVSYDRVMWNLNPVIVAHQVLVERGCQRAAELWRSSLEERIGPESKRHLVRLQALQTKYAMSLPSVSKRLSERFMRPLLIDHICSLVAPATADNEDERRSAFDRIQNQANAFLKEPSGAGLDVPTWLIALEDAVRTAQVQQAGSVQEFLEQRMPQPTALTADDIEAQIRSWMEDD